MKKQIVFIEPFPTSIIYKMAFIFKKKGYETILIRIVEANKEYNDFYKKAYGKIIDLDIPYSRINKRNFLKISFGFLKKSPRLFSSFLELKKLKPYIVFGRAPLSIPIAFFMKFFRKYAFVYFPYDIRRQAFKDFKEANQQMPSLEIKADRWCFEHSDGIMHKGNPKELEYLNGGMLGEDIKLPKHQIDIFPYCSEEFIVPFNKDKISKKDKQIHMVYIGGTGCKSEQFYFEQFKSAERILNEGIHVHFYFGSEISGKEELKKDEQIKKKFYGKYKNLKNIRYFHLEKSFNLKDIAKEISKYDFGFWPESDFNVKFATGNKFSTFIEAGLPFFYFKNLGTIDEIAKKYELGILAADDIKNFKKFIKKLDYNKLIESVKKTRKDYLMEKHFPRLEKFVRDVVMEKRLKDKS